MFYKTFLIIFMYFLSSNWMISFSQASNIFSVKVNFDSVFIGKVYLTYYSDILNKPVYDSSIVKNNVCTFNGKIHYKSVGFIKLIPGNEIDKSYSSFIIEKGKYEVFITTKSTQFRIKKAINSNTNNEYAQLLEQHEKVEIRRQSEIEKIQSKDSILHKEQELKINLQARTDKVTSDLEFFFKYPNSYVTVFKLQGYYNKLSLDSLELIYDKLNLRNKESFYGLQLKDQIERRSTKLIKGMKAQNFRGIDVNGNIITLNDYLGKNIIIDFWATWCKPCLEQFTLMNRVLNNNIDTNLVLITVADDRDKQSLWLSVINRLQMQSHINILNDYITPSSKKTINDLYNIQVLPTTYFIDKNLKIIEVTYGGLSEEKFLTILELLKK
ncbi:MAG: AhpC/TSA family protein [Hydrotalea sp.]|nr:AhpC/TSA family protein [Hydrotalea sp.]